MGETVFDLLDSHRHIIPARLLARIESAHARELQSEKARADARGHKQTLRAALEFVSKFTSGNSVMRDVRAIAVRAGPTIAQEATFLRDQINARLLPDSGEVVCPKCRGTGEVCTGTIDGVPELFDCDCLQPPHDDREG